ncbi:hypothetical protein M8J71_11620 [Pseudarthrobacter sp. R1]|uniref:hypothetical protein n=1 Tax=Pseudarthrobacter sp. R1 TaxID=2944934 RepID=UPI002108AADE|nr:hypothetical protein [Pseudarthrobacter sp. R1]MCQ6271130.1 hypothetical protein [Pseudarthrobacter sp. R1]
MDHVCDAYGVVQARLLELVPGLSGEPYADWLKRRGAEFPAGIRTAVQDSFLGYAHAMGGELPEGFQQPGRLTCCKACSAMDNEVGRRAQQVT